MLGTAFSVGCTVNGEAPMDIMQQIKDGEPRCRTRRASAHRLFCIVLRRVDGVRARPIDGAAQIGF